MAATFLAGEAFGSSFLCFIIFAVSLLPLLVYALIDLFLSTDLAVPAVLLADLVTARIWFLGFLISSAMNIQASYLCNYEEF